MEKLDDESAAKFINALIKSVQTLCHGYLDFHNGIEIIGHINLSVDKGSSLHYILEEKVCKNEENSTLFISNSFYARNQKSDSKGKGKDTQVAQAGNQVVQRTNSTDTGDVGKVSSAISSISSALSRSHEKSHSGSTSSAKDTNASHSAPVSSTAKRKASDDLSNDVVAAKSSHKSSSPSPVSHFLSQSPHDPSGSSSPVDTKPTLSELRGEDSLGTVLPQTAGVGGESASDLGVNLAGSVLERVDDHSNSDLPERGDDSDGDLEVTFIKEEYVEGEQSACQFENSGGQQYGRGTHQRASSSDNMPDASLYPVSLHHSASATFVPSAHDMTAAQHYGPSTSSQPQPGTSGVRGVQGHGMGLLGASFWDQCAKVRPEGQSQRGTPGALHGTPPEHPAASLGPMLVETLPHSQTPGQWQGCGQQGARSLAHTLKLRASSADPDPRSKPAALLKCQWCNALFKTPHGRKAHIRKNHGNDPNFRCEVCGKGFLMKGHYVGHMNMHFNVKSFECPTCPRKFAYKSSLKSHVKFCGLKVAAQRVGEHGGDGTRANE